MAHALPAASSPAATNLVALPVAGSAAFIATGAQIGFVAPSTFTLPAKQAPTSPAALSIKQDMPPRASAAAHPSSLRPVNGTPPQPVAVGGPLAPPNDGTDSPAHTNGAPPAIPPFSWATNRAAIHHPIAYLFERGITAVEGDVKCRRCDVQKTVSYNIAIKFREVRVFVSRNIHDMDDRAPAAWMSPVVPDCDGCGQKNSLRPVIPKEKESINWVFLLPGQTLGLCTLEQLKYFCARTGQHRTGAKDRVLYSTYMELCSQLCPDRLFNLTAERQKRGQQYS
ncbi:uncharacterized protein [Triticum aestivum]|uniref:uncharacterized protein n=1 Tax=Triticum aestivum TaxID=4565 RepID=UPI001D01CC97|nr:uncharacterized protein LOC123080850 [Triticum aestivum]